MALTKVTSGLISADASSVDLNIDAGTLYIDSTNNRVGVANTSPSATLDVNGTIKLDGNYPVGTDNVALGDTALDSVTSGVQNTAIGAYALTANTEGTGNVAIGRASLESNTTASNNTAIGKHALLANTTGTRNSFIGAEAGASTTGSYNSGLGYQSLYANTSGVRNVAVGDVALNSSTTANDNTALGWGGMINNTTGSNNVAVGSQALYNMSTTSNNTAVGYQSMYSSTGGGNTALGSETLYASTTGTGNVAVGGNVAGLEYSALRFNTTGGFNTALGVGSLALNTTGSSNTAVGFGAGLQITTGSKNTILGRYSGNQDALDIRTSSNNIVLSDGDGLPALRLQKLGSGYKNRWRPVYQGDATGYGSGAAANTWHEITAVEFNAVDYVDSSIKVYISFQNGNPTYGYVGLVMCEIPNAGSNVAYTGSCIIGTDVSGTSGYQIPITVATHTGTSSVYFELKMELTGSSKHLFIRSNVAQTTNTSAFGVPQMLVVIDGWIPD